MTQTFAFWIGVIVALVIAVLVLIALFPNASFLGARIDPNDARDAYYRCASAADESEWRCLQHAREFGESCQVSVDESDEQARIAVQQCRDREREIRQFCRDSYDSELEACHEDAYGTGF